MLTSNIVCRGQAGSGLRPNHPRSDAILAPTQSPNHAPLTAIICTCMHMHRHASSSFQILAIPMRLRMVSRFAAANKRSTTSSTGSISTSRVSHATYASCTRQASSKSARRPQAPRFAARGALPRTRRVDQSLSGPLGGASRPLRTRARAKTESSCSKEQGEEHVTKKTEPSPAKKENHHRTHFKATLEEVWELWTTKDGIESWWGPEGSW